MKYDIDYNSQRDNYSFNGKFKGFIQCFSTSSFMLMSYFSNNMKGDDRLKEYVDDVESTVGKPGIAEKVKKKFNWITGRTSLWWLVQKYGIEKWLWNNGVEGDCIFSDCEHSIYKLPELLKISPVILGTNKIGGLKGGHIILVIGYESGVFICHDPYGNARHNYKDHNGDSVEYTLEYLKKYTDMKNGKIRCMYWQGLEK